MQILAGSLNVQVDSFLHSGYTSAYPRTYQREGPLYLINNKVKLIDVKKAVELKPSKDQVACTVAIAAPSPVLRPASMVSDTFVLAIVFLFFAYIRILYYRCIRGIAKSRWKPLLFAAGAIIGIACIQYLAWPAYQTYSLNHLAPPWKNVAIAEYQDPEAVTDMILRGLIENGLLGTSIAVHNLSAIQNEVAFPFQATQYTPGMKYAQRTYGRDGWGREFSLNQLDAGKYSITSAGPDGVMGTKDDIILITPSEESGWEQRIGGVFFRIADGHEVIFLHRVDDPLFLFANAKDARKQTGTDLFDQLGMDELQPAYREPPFIAMARDKRKLAQAKDASDELLFVQFERTKDGQ
jgi:hypothetical protein